MEMNAKKMGFEDMMQAADKRLMELGLQDTVNMFLATQEAKDAVAAVFDGWLEVLKEYADKMPDVARADTIKYAENLKKGQKGFEESVFLYFKKSLGDTIARLAAYVAQERENKMELTLELKQLWLGTLSKQARDMADGIEVPAKADLTCVAITTIKQAEDMDALFDVMQEDPNSTKLMTVVDARVTAARIVQGMLLTKLDPMVGMPGVS